MKNSTLRIVGWVLSVLLAAFLIIASAGLGKFMDSPDKAAQLAKIGFTADLMYKIGVVEVVIAILYVIPWTSFLGAVLLTAYLGGAVCAHVRIGESPIPPIVIGVVLWFAYGLRAPQIFALAFGIGKEPPAKA